MPLKWPIEGEREFVSAAPGVYEASFAFLGEEWKHFDWSPEPLVHMRFELEGEGITASLSLPPEALVHTVGLMTRRQVPGNVSPEEMLRTAHALLANFQWRGLVNVGKKGFIRRLQVPSGVYEFHFSCFSTQMDDRAGWIEYTAASGDQRRLSIVELEVLTPEKYRGYRQSCLFPPTFHWHPETGDLSLSGDALLAVLAATGVVMEDLHEDVEEKGGVRAYFADPANPFPELEALMFDRAEAGHRIAGVVREDGNAPWGALVASSIEGTLTTPVLSSPPIVARPSEEQTLCDLMQLLSDRVWEGGEGSVFEESGALAGPGLHLGRAVLKPSSELFPSSGVVPRWPPTTWEEGGLAFAIDVFAALTSLEDVELRGLIANREKMEAWMKDIWGDADAPPF